MKIGERRDFRHFFSKNQKKTNDEISRKCQKTGFSGIFPAFSPGKIARKIGLGHILDIAVFYHEKYKVQLEKFKKCRFTAKIGCSGDF